MYWASVFVVQRSHRAARRVSFLTYLFAVRWNLPFYSQLLIIQIVHGHVMVWCISWTWNLGNFFWLRKNRVFCRLSVNFACVFIFYGLVFLSICSSPESYLKAFYSIWDGEGIFSGRVGRSQDFTCEFACELYLRTSLLSCRQHSCFVLRSLYDVCLTEPSCI